MSKKYLVVCAVGLTFAGAAGAQAIRITGKIDNSQRLTLHGHLRPQANAANDQGRVSPSLELPYLTLTLSQTADQKAQLAALLAAQQTPGSAEYHQWLTPEQYADRFGVSQTDIGAIRQWLESQGFSVIAAARGRTWIAFRGTAAQVEAAFQTEIHNYLVNGEMHYANASEPSVPAALGGVILGIRGLSDFRMKPRLKARNISPMYTSSGGQHYLAPDDIATIYDIGPLYSAGISGTGQTLVIAGQTTINLSDIETFRTQFGLPANNPTTMLVPGERSPGLSSDDLPEADLDLEWSGAIARNATILFVYSEDVMTAVQYAIDDDLAPVVSVSYGDCELETPGSELLAYQSWGQQGNAEGITWFAPAGDDGAADCGDTANPGLAVDAPASTPEVTGVGGTEFAEGTGVYWNATNSSTGASARSYIPETTWNDGCTPDNGCSATGGGASVVWPKPTWQTGLGVPADNARDVPDIALSASADHDGYLVYTGGEQQVYGGTSGPTPEFAAITTLLNQYLVTNGAQAKPGQGNINPHLYSLAASDTAIFHDITSGNNIVQVECSKRSIVCNTQPVGYSAHAGYNQSTGWGSVDVNLLITGWNGSGSVTPPPSNNATMTLISNLTTVGSPDTLYVIATVVGSNGVTPAGVVSFTGNNSNLGTATLVGSAGTATATLVITGDELQTGTAVITATYSGASNSPTATVNVNVVPRSVANGTPTISQGGLVNAASYQATFAPGAFLAVFGSTLAPSTQAASSLPLPVTMAGVSALVNGEVAPLYYVSSGLVSLQIPYEVTTGTATVTINNNGQVTTQSFTVAATAPGIYTDGSGNVVATAAVNGTLTATNSASVGQEIAIYVNGAGALSTAIADGAAPSTSSNQPVATITLTVGGVSVTNPTITMTPGSVGVTQLNFTVPSGLATGKQPVVVTVGSAQSAPANLNVTN
ncbi:MAG TPA: protease pro-enzyme activation domain-containing protein [Bryobacteraceae bacterium]|nr:protease pro-enzyme activation domain-containing protein [Bryobacteraceae bacterium]